MERVSIEQIEYLIGYHTQEFRPASQPLEKPIKCVGSNAWLGIGYYFWTEEDFAHYWGEDFKIQNTGYYDIYKGILYVENCINAVFDEDGYLFFRQKIEETIEHFKSKKVRVSLEQVNRFLADNIWPELGVEGIIYDDKPTNPKRSDRVYSEIPDLYYKKRIQVVLFKLENIRTFAIHLEEQNRSQ